MRTSRLLVVVVLLLGAGCSEEGSKGSAQELVLYAGRSESLVAPLVEKFESESGIEVRVKYGQSAQLALALQEEGAHSPADVFWAQDAGSLGALCRSGAFKALPRDVVDPVPSYFRDSDLEWVATSGRARCFAYAPDRVDNKPASVFDLTDARWKGRVGWAPANASFQSFVTAMRITHGDDKARAWLVAMRDNGAKAYAKNTAIIEAIAAGEVDLGLPNHYYLLRFKKQDPDFPVEQSFFEDRDIGNLINVAGVGVLRTAKNNDAAQQFVEFLLSRQAQTFLVENVYEYPVVDYDIHNPSLVDMKSLMTVAPEVELNDLDELQGTLDMLREVGLL